MHFGKILSISSSRTRNILMCRNPHSIGYGVIKPGEDRCYGPDRYNVGVTMILKVRQGTDLRSIGPYDTRMLPRGIAMLKNSWVSPGTKTVWMLFRMGNFYPLWN